VDFNTRLSIILGTILQCGIIASRTDYVVMMSLCGILEQGLERVFFHVADADIIA
jgi:hypothetical protein